MWVSCAAAAETKTNELGLNSHLATPTPPGPGVGALTSIVRVGSSPHAAARVPLTSVAVDAEKIGFEAARLLERQLAGETIPPGIVMRVPPLGVVGRHSTDVVAIEDPLVAEAVGFMREQLGRNLTIETVVEHLRVSRRQLEQHFKAMLGRSPGSELRRLRIARAMDLMDNTDLPLADIAVRAGFGDASVLSQTFRRETGTTPSAYRQRGRLR